MFHEKAKELSLTVRLSHSQPMQVAIQQLDATAVLGGTEINVRVPISHNHDDIRAPIPCAYAVVCKLIQVNFNFEHLVRSVLRAKQQQSGNPVTSTSEYERDDIRPSMLEPMTILRLAEIIPNDLRFEIHKLEVNIVDKLSGRDPGSTFDLELSRLSVMLSGDSGQEIETMSTTNYPEVPRRIDLTLGPLVVYLSEGDGSADTTVRAPALKLIGLKINAESTISAEDSSHDSADEIIETDTQEPVLRLRSTISGENRARGDTFKES